MGFDGNSPVSMTSVMPTSPAIAPDSNIAMRIIFFGETPPALRCEWVAAAGAQVVTEPRAVQQHVIGDADDDRHDEHTGQVAVAADVASEDLDHAVEVRNATRLVGSVGYRPG